MANYQLLIDAINRAVYTNHNNEIDAPKLKGALVDMVQSLGYYFQFNGVATPETILGTPDPKVAYIAATPGNYDNGITVLDGEVAILQYNGYTWDKVLLPISTNASTNQQVYSEDADINKAIKELYVWDNNYSANAVYRIENIARHYSGNNQWNIVISKNGVAWLQYYTAVDPESGVFHFEDTVNGFGFYGVINWEAIEYGEQIHKDPGIILSHNIFNLQFSPYIMAYLLSLTITELQAQIAPLGNTQQYTRGFVAQAGQQNLLSVAAGTFSGNVTIEVDEISTVPALRIIVLSPYSEYDIPNPSAGDKYTFDGSQGFVVAVVNAAASGTVKFTLRSGLYQEVQDHEDTLDGIGRLKIYSLGFSAQAGVQNLGFISDFDGEVAVRIKELTGTIGTLRLGVDDPYSVVDIKNPKVGDVYRVQGVTSSGGNLYVASVDSSAAGAIGIEVTQNRIKDLLMLRSILCGDKVSDSNVMRTIDCVGDSLTVGAGSLPFTGFLETALRYRYLVNNYGVGGENAATILGRMNGIPYQLGADATIPAAVTPVQVTLVNIYGQKLLPLLQGASSLLVRIAGVDGVLTTSQTDPTANTADYFFTRATSGSAINVMEGECVWVRDTAEAALPYRDKVIWIGQNGGYGHNDADRYAGNPNQQADIARLCKMIKTYAAGLQGGRYIVLSPPKATSDLLEETMQEEFGGAFLNVRRWMMANGIRVAQEVGMLGSGYPTAEDLTDIANGLIPRCLRSDSVHFNSAGYAAIGYAIAYQIQNIWGIQ